MYREARRARYYAVFSHGVEPGVDPAPYFYVYSVTDVDPIQYALAKRPDLGVDFLTYSSFIEWEEFQPAAVYAFIDGRWLPTRPTKAYIIKTVRPEHVAQVREVFLDEEAFKLGVYASGFNIKYPVRVAWDRGLYPLEHKPLWKAGANFDFRIPHGLELVVFDIEVLADGVIMVSLLRHRLGEEPSAENVETIICKEGRECDELLEAFRGARILYGHNILGFDIPHLLRRWFVPELALASKLDGVKILSTHGNSFQIGASRSLLAVAHRLKRQAGITDEELSIKEESGAILSSGDLEKIRRYNVNDVIITAKIANVLLPFIYSMAMLIGVPPSVVQELQAGVLAEYLLFRALESRGILPGYKQSKANMEGSKVLLPCSVTSTGQTLLDYLKSLGLEG